MNLKTFFEMKNTPIDATCVSVGTDGLSMDRNNIMSVSYWGPEDLEPTTVYISGADADKAEQYTGVSPEKYEKEAVGILRAEEILRDHVKTDLVVSFTVNNFTRRWLSLCLPVVFGPGRHMWFDVLSYVAFCDGGNPFPAKAETPADLCRVVNQTRGVRFQDAAASRLPVPDVLDPVSELPILEQRIHHLRGLWDFCKNKEL